jgi:purine-binding chemotaxis protein CheW
VVKQDGQAILLIAPAELLESEAKTADAGSVSTSNRLEQATKAAEDVRRTVVLEIGREEFGIDIGLVSEAVRFVQPTPVPDAPPFLAGLITLRANILPVVELRTLMQRSSLREETIQKIGQLRAEFSKARTALDQPNLCAGILTKAHRLLESLGLRSTRAIQLIAQNSEVLKSVQSLRGAAPTATREKIEGLLGSLADIENDVTDSDRRILVIETADARFGLAVDRVTQVLDLPEASLQPPRRSSKTPASS